MAESTPQLNTIKHEDHRYFPRWEVNSRILFQVDNDAQLHEAHTRDLSCAGASICTYYPLQQQQQIKITLFLPNGMPVNLQGEVLWSATQKNQELLLGVSFFNTSKEAQQKILQQAFEVNRQEIISNWFKGWTAN